MIKQYAYVPKQTQGNINHHTDRIPERKKTKPSSKDKTSFNEHRVQNTNLQHPYQEAEV